MRIETKISIFPPRVFSIVVKVCWQSANPCMEIYNSYYKRSMRYDTVL